MNILVTGATGFVGNLLLKDLRKAFPRSKISAFVMPDDPFKTSLIQFNGLHITEGNIINSEDVLNAVSGHTHVVHLAGFISYYRKDTKKLFAVNKTGVNNIVEACLKHNVTKLIHISSVGACGFFKDGRLADERTPFNWPRYFTYMVSKLEGQQIVEQACKEKGLNAVILLPASIMGPGDRNIQTPHNQLYYRIYRKRLFGSFSGGLAIVDVRDLVEIIIKCLESRISGEKYLIVGQNVEYSQVLRAIGKYANKKTYPFPVPAFLLSVLGGLLERISLSNSRKPLITYAYGKLSGWKTYYSNEKSRREFNHEYRPLDRTIEDSCKYFEENFL